MSIITVAVRKRIALIAHDSKKPELLLWAAAHREQLAQHELLGTGTTGRMVENALGLPVRQYLVARSAAINKSVRSSRNAKSMC